MGVDDDNDCLVDCADPDCFADAVCVSGCSGTPHDCSVFVTKINCNTHADGCSWSNSLKVCEGIHNACLIYVDDAMCVEHGCIWG